jgi:hypothetical protein
LTGALPKVFSELSEQLSKLALSDNLISGALPPDYSVMNSLGELDLSMNAVTGTLPAAFASMESIRDINLCCNKLRGTLPDSWGHSAMPLQRL